MPHANAIIDEFTGLGSPGWRYTQRHPERHRQNGRRSYFKDVERSRELARIRVNKYYKDNPEKFKLKCKKLRDNNLEKYRETEELYRDNNRLKRNLTAIKTRAKKRGLEFDLKEEDVIMPTHCPILGLKLEWAKGSPKDNSPSLDRLDNSKGYIKGNIRVISYRANTYKNNMTREIAQRIVDYMDGKL
jgi:hypothetical protein